MDDKMIDQRLVSDMQATVAWLTARLAGDLDAAKAVLTADNVVPVLLGTTDAVLALVRIMSVLTDSTPEAYLQTMGRMIARMEK